MNRRNALTGLAGIFAAGFAPAAVGSVVLMPVRKVVGPASAGRLVITGFGAAQIGGKEILARQQK